MLQRNIALQLWLIRRTAHHPTMTQLTHCTGRIANKTCGGGFSIRFV